MIKPHIAHWALKRIRSEPRLAAEFAACMSRYRRTCGRLSSSERILRAEPISTVIGLTALISSIGVSTAVAGAIGGALIGVAFSVAANYAIGALAKQNQGANQVDSGSAVNTPESRYSTRQASPSKRIIYGEAQVGFALFFEQVKPPYLYHGGLICDEQINAFKRMWIGTQEVTLPGFTPNTILTPIAAPGAPNYQNRLLVSLGLGSSTQAIDPILAAAFASLDTNFRQRGIARAVMRYHFGTDQADFTATWGQVPRPNALFLVEGIAVPDPRNPAHILDWDPTDDDEVAAARASWSYSSTAALCQAHYLTQRYGGRYRPSRVDWDKVRFAADYDDSLIGCADGTLIKRHAIHGVITLNQRPVDVLQSMLTANRGFVLGSRGRVWVSSSAPQDPIATISDKHLVGGLQYQAGKPKRSLCNRIRSQFVAPDREYQTVEGPLLSRTDLQAIDGEILEKTNAYPFTNDHRVVQRLQDADLESERLEGSLTTRVVLEWLASCKEDPIGKAVTFDSTLFSKANGTYLVRHLSFAPDYSSIELALVRYDKTIETSWNAATDEQPFLLANLNVS